VLAALIIHAVSHLWKVKEFRLYRREQPLEFWVGLVTLAGVITIDVLPGLVIGVVSMIILVVYQASRPHISMLGRVPGVPDAYGDVERHPDYAQIPGVLLLRLEAPLFYANASLVVEAVKRFAGACDPHPKAVILDFSPNANLDITSSEKLGELVTARQSAQRRRSRSPRSPLPRLPRATGSSDDASQDGGRAERLAGIEALAPIHFGVAASSVPRGRPGHCRSAGLGRRVREATGPQRALRRRGIRRRSRGRPSGRRVGRPRASSSRRAW
jgi:MFS superfamily sulfate permease-like transporter